MIVQNNSFYDNNHNFLESVSAGFVAETTFTQVSSANRPDFFGRIWDVVDAAFDWARSWFSDKTPKRVEVDEDEMNFLQRIENLRDQLTRLTRCMPEDREAALAEFRVTCPLPNFNFTELSRAYTGFKGPYRHIELPYLNLIKNEDHDWLTKVDRLMDDSDNFQMISEGTSGSYWIKDETGRRVAIFKFNDEVTGQPGNPKGFSGDNFDSEDAAEREFAAWVIGGALAGVPEAHVVDVFHSGKQRRGCLIKFVEADGTLYDLYYPFIRDIFERAGISSDKNVFDLTVEDNMKLMTLLQDSKMLWDYERNNHIARKEIVERFEKVIFKIAILDILIGNFDRSNPANVLDKEYGGTGAINVIPIDHNLAFPGEITSYLIPPFWMGTPQFMFGSLDAESRRYIENLDLKVLKKQLKDFSLSERRVKGVWLRGLLLKKGVQAGLSLFEIAQMMTVEKIEMDLGKLSFRSSLSDVISDVNEVLKGEEVPKEEKLQRGFEIFGSLLNEEIAERKEQIERQGVSDQAKYTKAMTEALESNDYSRFEYLYNKAQRRVVGEDDDVCLLNEERYAKNRTTCDHMKSLVRLGLPTAPSGRRL